MTTSTYGYPCNEQALATREGLSLVISPRSQPLQRRWRNNAVSADFMADYFATFFPGEGDEGTRAEARAAVSYIANELLENSMKYSDTSSEHPISLRLVMGENTLLFVSTHQAEATQADRYRGFVQRLSEGDAHAMLLERARNVDTSESGLGLLTIVTDYGGRLGWRFDGGDPGMLVSTFVELSF